MTSSDEASRVRLSADRPRSEGRSVAASKGVTVSNGRGDSSDLPENAFAQALRESTDAADQLKVLLQLADDDDTDAMMFAAELFERCAGARPTSDKDVMRLDYVCRGLPLQPGRQVRGLYLRAALLGDERAAIALAENLPRGNHVRTGWLESAAASGNAVAIARLEHDRAAEADEGAANASIAQLRSPEGGFRRSQDVAAFARSIMEAELGPQRNSGALESASPGQTSASGPIG